MKKRQKRRIDTIVSFDYVISFLFFQNKKKWSNPKYKSTYQQAKWTNSQLFISEQINLAFLLGAIKNRSVSVYKYTTI